MTPEGLMMGKCDVEKDNVIINVALRHTERVFDPHSKFGDIDIVYVIESAAYGVLCTTCLCQKPERASEGF